ncbi:E3 ubiquitin-protein ligase MPSR1-like [Capsicum galapagoense]
MSNYRQNHRSFRNHTHHHQQRQRGYYPRNTPRLPSYQSSIRHPKVHNDPENDYSSFLFDGSYATTDHHENFVPQFQDQTVVSDQPPLPSNNPVDTVLPSIVVNNHSPIDDVSVATESNETSGNMLVNTNNMTDQERTSGFSFRSLRYRCLNFINCYYYYCLEEKEGDDSVLKYLTISTHYAPATDEVDREVVAGVEPSETCAICLSEFEHEKVIGSLQCGHEYHVGCIKQWLLMKKDCPVCRALV